MIGETLGLKDSTKPVVGMIGVLLIWGPFTGTSRFSGALIGLSIALFNSLLDFIVRQAILDINLMTISLISTVFGLLFSLLLGPFLYDYNFSVPSSYALILVMSIFFFLSQYSLVKCTTIPTNQKTALLCLALELILLFVFTSMYDNSEITARGVVGCAMICAGHIIHVF